MPAQRLYEKFMVDLDKYDENTEGLHKKINLIDPSGPFQILNIRFEKLKAVHPLTTIEVIFKVTSGVWKNQK